MGKIKIMKKPAWISWEDVQSCLYLAQQTNVKKGFDMLFGHYSATQIKQEVGDGECFVALNENNKVVGTCSYKIASIKRWWCKGKAAYLCLAGILPEYQGQGIYSLLCKEREKYIFEGKNIDTIWFNTADKNITVQKKFSKEGFKKVQFSPSGKGANYYSVLMAKWPRKKICPRVLISFMYLLSIVVVKLLYKPGKINRFTF